MIIFFELAEKVERIELTAEDAIDAIDDDADDDDDADADDDDDGSAIMNIDYIIIHRCLLYTSNEYENNTRNLYIDRNT